MVCFASILFQIFNERTRAHIGLGTLYCGSQQWEGGNLHASLMITSTLVPHICAMFSCVGSGVACGTNPFSTVEGTLQVVVFACIYADAWSGRRGVQARLSLE